MQAKTNEILTFLRSALSNPRRIGAVLPSSPGLGRLMSRHIDLASDGAILEIGAGTGVVTQTLLEAGVPRDRLYVLELDKRLAEFLQQRFPGVAIINGNAADAARLIPPHLVGKISTVVSSLPIRMFPFAVQKAITDAAFEVLTPGAAFIQYTYPAKPPLPSAALGLKAEWKGHIWINVPPAAVWRFTRA